MDRCDECGFVYDLSEAPEAGPTVVAFAGRFADLLGSPGVDLRTRRRSEVWSPLEYACHVRDVLLVQRERVLAARRVDRPVATPMGRDERVDHDGYAEQDPAAVSRQLADAAALFANVLARLGPGDWDRTMAYTYPQRTDRPVRWVAVHSVHEMRHHLLDAERQLNLEV
jgi:DinB family protein